MRDRRCFLAHFAICLAIGAGFFLSWINGVPQLIYASDESHVTSILLGFFVFTSLVLGVSAWEITEVTSTAYGHFAETVSVLLGMLGTTIGLSIQAKTLISGSAGLLPLSTSLFTTGVGIACCIAIKVMTFNLQRGIERRW